MYCTRIANQLSLDEVTAFDRLGQVSGRKQARKEDSSLQQRRITYAQISMLEKLSCRKSAKNRPVKSKDTSVVVAVTER
jgi:hypothetical protein